MGYIERHPEWLDDETNENGEEHAMTFDESGQFVSVKELRTTRPAPKTDDNKSKNVQSSKPGEEKKSNTDARNDRVKQFDDDDDDDEEDEDDRPPQHTVNKVGHIFFCDGLRIDKWY